MHEFYICVNESRESNAFKNKQTSLTMAYLNLLTRDNIYTLNAIEFLARIPELNINANKYTFLSFDSTFNKDAYVFAVNKYNELCKMCPWWTERSKLEV